MSNFSTFDDFAPIAPGSLLYDMRSSCVWDIGKRGSGWSLELKPGRTFDISVPKWLRWLLSPHDRNVLMAARVHDELLEEGFDQAFASSEFRRALKVRGMSVGQSWVLFVATLLWTTLKPH